jgi:hypothetical protein
MSFPEPSTANDYLVTHIQVLQDSYRHYLGQDLVDADLSPEAAARQIYHAPFVVVSHNAAADPVFTYGNQTALALFEMTWSEFTQLPSRRSAEPPSQAERDQLLGLVTTQGFIADYAGIRISKGGRRFWIRGVTVWNLRDAQNQSAGQAAAYRDWADI